MRKPSKKIKVAEWTTDGRVHSTTIERKGRMWCWTTENGAAESSSLGSVEWDIEGRGGTITEVENDKYEIEMAAYVRWRGNENLRKLGFRWR
jgi:hypothetical protein